MAESSFVSTIGSIRKALRRKFEAQATPLDITAAQFQVLKRLWMGDGITTSVLTQDSGSDGGTITGILDRLESRGLIRRERSAQDRRSVQIWLTPAGRELESPLTNILESLDAQALKGLSHEEKTLITQILKRVWSNLEE